MAREKGQRKGRDKWKEKSWYTIMSPDYMGGKELTVSPSSDESSMIGRHIEVSIADLTGNFKKSNAKVIFRVDSCQGSKCSTTFIGHSISDDYIKRMVRRRKERIDIIKTFKLQDNFQVAVKIVVVTDGKLTNTKRLEIRNTISEFLKTRLENTAPADTAKYIIGDDIYSDIVQATKDVYPIKKLEVRKSEFFTAGEQRTMTSVQEDTQTPEQV
ncbi:MAG: 30S ribosomal protein S3ae [Thermoplasmataceae archaeon]